MKKLSKTQKAKNKALYKTIRKEYNKVKNSPENIRGGKPVVDYIGFKRRVKARAKNNNISIKEAAKQEARTESFLGAGERSRENLVTALKEKHRAEYNELRNLSRSKGKFQKISGNLNWDKDKGGYVLNADGKQFFIDITNSPEEVNIVEIE